MTNALVMSQGDLYAATCSWLDGAVGIDGAGAPVVLVVVTIATMVLWWMLGGTSKTPNTLGKKVHACAPRSLLQCVAVCSAIAAARCLALIRQRPM